MTSTLHLRNALVASAAVAMLALAGCSSAGAQAPAESAGSAASGASDWPDTLTFAQIPSESSTAIAEQNEAIIAGLEQRLSEEAGKPIEVELQEATSYAAVIEALRAGQVQIGAMGPFSYVVAADGGAGVAPLGALADTADEAGGYQSYGIVPAGSDITDLAGFAGKTVCFVDPTSTSGFLFPSAGLLEEGIDPETGVEPVFAGGHDASALSVANGTCDAGFAFDAIVDSVLIESGQLAAGDLETVWKSDVIPSSPYVVSTQLPADLQETIRSIFIEDLNRPALVELGVCASEEECAMPEETEYGFVPVEDSLYDGIRAVCEVTKSDSCVA
jgi:phosphonate transport system substrate-binding protein